MLRQQPQRHVALDRGAFCRRNGGFLRCGKAGCAQKHGDEDKTLHATGFRRTRSPCSKAAKRHDSYALRARRARFQGRGRGGGRFRSKGGIFIAAAPGYIGAAPKTA
jgi:hypothetical protein